MVIQVSHPFIPQINQQNPCQITEFVFLLLIGFSFVAVNKPTDGKVFLRALGKVNI